MCGICMCVCITKSVCVYMFVCTSVFMCVCICVCVCVCVCVYTVIKRMKFQIREPGLKHSPVLGSCVIISVISSTT